MAIEVDATRLPFAVEVGAVFTLTTDTSIKTALNGREARQAKRVPRWEATVSVGPEYADEVRDLYLSQYGPRYAFAVRNYADYQVRGEVIVPNDAGGYPLTITRGPGTRKLVKDVLVVDEDTLVVYVDGAPVTGFTLTDGVLTGVGGGVVSYDADIFWPMRFADDNLAINITAGVDSDGVPLKSVQQFRLIEVLP